VRKLGFPVRILRGLVQAVIVWMSEIRAGRGGITWGRKEDIQVLEPINKTTKKNLRGTAVVRATE
jgi:hypothetical protein